MVAPEQWLNYNTKSVGRLQKAGSPRRNDRSARDEYKEFRTDRCSGIEMYTSDDATNGPGMCYYFKRPNGGGTEYNHAGHCWEENRAGKFTITKFEEVRVNNGNVLDSTHNNYNLCSTGISMSANKGQGGSSSINGANENTATALIRFDRSVQFSAGSSMGFSAGRAMGFVAKDIAMGAATNIGLGASGGIGVAAEKDCMIGSQSGCLHGYGNGISFGSKGPSTYQSVSGSMNILTDSNEVNINPGGGSPINLWTAGQVNVQTPAMVAMDGSSVYINSGKSQKGTRIDRNMNVQMTGIPPDQSVYNEGYGFK